MLAHDDRSLTVDSRKINNIRLNREKSKEDYKTALIKTTNKMRK